MEQPKATRWALILATLLCLLIAACDSGKSERVIFRCEGGWYMPPAFHGNPFATGGDGTYMHFIWEKLFLFVPGTEKYIPRLAIGYELADQRRTLVVRLRPEVVWHDLCPFTSADVKATFLIRYALGWGGALRQIATPDRHTVVFYWRRPLGPIDVREIFNQQIMAPQHLFARYCRQVEPLIGEANKLPLGKLSDQHQALYQQLQLKKAQIMQAVYKFRPEKPVGTGPFRFAFVTGSDLGLVKFSKGWQAANVTIDDVHIVKGVSNDIAWAYLISGDIDAAHPATPQDVARQVLKLNPKTRLILPSDYGEFGFIFNMKKAPMSDLNFRRAIAHAVNKDLVRMISYYCATTVGPYSHGVLHSLSAKWLDRQTLAKMTAYRYDVGKARRILAKAGYRRSANGYYRTPRDQPIRLEIAAIAGHSDWVLGCESFCNQLEKLGIQAQIRTYEPSLYHQLLTNNQFDIAANFGSDYKSYAHPGPSFNRYFGTGAYLKVASGMPDICRSYDGHEIVLAKAVENIYYQDDPVKLKATVGHLAWIANEYLPFLTIYEKNLMVFLVDGVRVKGWPDANDPLWTMSSCGLETLFAYLMTSGRLQGVK